MSTHPEAWPASPAHRGPVPLPAERPVPCVPAQEHQVQEFGLRAGEVILPPFHEASPHRHSSGWICIVSEGTIWHSAADAEQSCAEGTMVYCPPEQLHAIRVMDAPARLLVVEIESHRLAQFLPLFARPEEPVHVRIENVGAAVPLRLRAELRSTDRGAGVAIDALVSMMIVEASRLASRTQRPPRWMTEATALIESHFHEALSLADVACALGVSTEHLAHRFKATMGCSVGQYIRRLRVERASRLLAETHQELSEIAACCGFYDQSHFGRTFRELTGVTPAEFRRRLWMAPS